MSKGHGTPQQTPDCTEQRMACTSLTQHIQLPSAGSAQHLCIG